MSYDPKISLIIPVLNAAVYLPELFKAVRSQQPSPPFEIILVDSNSTDNSCEIAKEYKEVKVIPINNFSHGRARNLGASLAKGDIVVFLSQDALPADQLWLRNLVAPFQDKTVAATYSRQTPRQDAVFIEVFFLNHRFPPAPAVRREKKHTRSLSLQDVFFSNVSAAIRRSVLLTHPFDESLIMSEDQQFSRDVINAGFAVVYVPDSVVIHSHNYNLRTAFRRYFDMVYSLTEIFPNHSLATSSAMGTSYLREELRFVLKNHPRQLPFYFCYNFAKISGAVLAHFANYLPRSLLKRISLHSYHW